MEGLKRYKIILATFIRLRRGNVQRALESSTVRALTRNRPGALRRICGFLQREHYSRNHHREVPGTGGWSIGETVNVR